jgi:hypothetical protein
MSGRTLPQSPAGSAAEFALHAMFLEATDAGLVIAPTGAPARVEVGVVAMGECRHVASLHHRSGPTVTYRARGAASPHVG